MNENFLSNIYGTLFNPVNTFEKLKNVEHPPVFEAFWVLVIVSVLGCLNSYTYNNVFFLGLSVVTYTLFALVSWVLFASILDTLFSISSKISKFDILLTLTGFSLLPWLLMGPIGLFKTVGIVGILISITISVIIWIWATILFIFAVSITYELSIGKVLLLIIMPFLGFLITLSWFAGFISNIVSILTVNSF